MSLIICPECKKQISKNVDKCPNCGCLMGKKQNMSHYPDNDTKKVNRIQKLWNEIFWEEFKKNSLVNKAKIVRDISVTLLTFLVPILIYILQAKHDENSLKPYINFNLSKNKSSVDVEIKNSGVGPAIITDVSITQNGEVVNADNLYDGIEWNSEYSFKCNDGRTISNEKANINFVKNYYADFIDETLAPGESFVLLQYIPNSDDNDENDDNNESDENEKIEQIRIMRYILTNMEMTIEYDDIYDNNFNVTEDFSTYKSQFVLPEKE